MGPGLQPILGAPQRGRKMLPGAIISPYLARINAIPINPQLYRGITTSYNDGEYGYGICVPRSGNCNRGITNPASLNPGFVGTR